MDQMSFHTPDGRFDIYYDHKESNTLSPAHVDEELRIQLTRIVRVMDEKRVSRNAYRDLAGIMGDMQREYKGMYG